MGTLIDEEGCVDWCELLWSNCVNEQLLLEGSKIIGGMIGLDLALLLLCL